MGRARARARRELVGVMGFESVEFGGVTGRLALRWVQPCCC